MSSSETTTVVTIFVRLLFAAALLPCGCRHLPPISVPASEAAEPAEETSGTLSYEHELRPMSIGETGVFVWPFQAGEEDWQVTIADIDNLHLGLWLEDTAVANSASTVTGGVKGWIAGARSLGYYLVDSPESYPSDSPLEKARSLGAGQLIVGSCLPGTSDRDLVIQMLLYDVEDGAEVVSAVNGICQDCRSSELLASTEQLVERLILDWRSVRLPGS